jgi:hypothetical protein
VLLRRLYVLFFIEIDTRRTVGNGHTFATPRVEGTANFSANYLKVQPL